MWGALMPHMMNNSKTNTALLGKTAAVGTGRSAKDGSNHVRTLLWFQQSRTRQPSANSLLAKAIAPSSVRSESRPSGMARSKYYYDYDDGYDDYFYSYYSYYCHYEHGF